MRSPFLHGVLVVMLLLLLASPAQVSAQRKMFMQAAFNPSQTDRGVSVIITGRVFDPINIPIPNAVISIQITNPQGSSIHVAIAYTDFGGSFQDSFLLPPSSPGGNYTAFLVADKPGYDPVTLTLIFTYSTPDFSLEASATTISLQQGQTGSLTITVLSLRGFNQPVNLTALELPSGVTLQFNPASIVPSGTATVSVAASNSAAVGNYTITLLAVSGALSHRTSFQLNIRPGPFQVSYIIFVVLVIFVLSAMALLVRFRGKRRRREAVIEELIKQASADTGYVATARVIARLEELRAMGKVDEATYQRLRREYEKRLEKSK